MTLTDSSGREWYPDSGATAHVTSSPEGLQNATQYHGLESIMVADGNNAPITHVGSTNLSVSTCSLPLNDVLVCPSVQKPLLSVSKLCEDYPCGVFFDANKACILDLQTMKVLTQGPRRNGLYVLENQDYKVFYSTRQQAADVFTWHHRLGHASSSVLQQLQNSSAISLNKSLSSLVCEPCQMAKRMNLPFSVSESWSVEPLAKFHCDLWGPSPVMSVQGFKFYAVFIDDYSRFSWFYPLRSKSEFFDIFLLFQKRVENQFDKRIKVFQSDGGGEFTSNRLQKHFQDNGIAHHKSCPYTPAQNGIAERKHRHIVELGLSMMFQSQVPLHHWVEGFFTATHLINMLHSSSLKNKTPHEVLHNQKPDYSYLRVFGSACYPCLRSYSAHKFEPRSLQCVFVGYNADYKGYRCLYPPTGRVYISRHVIFDEKLFPFTGKFKHLIPQYPTALLQAWQKASTPEASAKNSPSCLSCYLVQTWVVDLCLINQLLLQLHHRHRVQTTLFPTVKTLMVMLHLLQFL